MVSLTDFKCVFMATSNVHLMLFPLTLRVSRLRGKAEKMKNWNRGKNSSKRWKYSLINSFPRCFQEFFREIKWCQKYQCVFNLWENYRLTSGFYRDNFSVSKRFKNPIESLGIKTFTWNPGKVDESGVRNSNVVELRKWDLIIHHENRQILMKNAKYNKIFDFDFRMLD